MVTEDQIQALEQTHGRIAVVASPDSKSWQVVLRKPKRAEYKMFRAHSGDPVKRSEAQETLFKQTCVAPTGAELEALLDEWPGIPEACGAALMSLAGMTGVESGK